MTKREAAMWRYLYLIFNGGTKKEIIATAKLFSVCP